MLRPMQLRVQCSEGPIQRSCNVGYLTILRPGLWATLRITVSVSRVFLCSEFVRKIPHNLTWWRGLSWVTELHFHSGFPRNMRFTRVAISRKCQLLSAPTSTAVINWGCPNLFILILQCHKWHSVICLIQN
jgi:hypothetical protein